MHRSTRHDATPCSSWTRQLDAFRTAHLHHLASTTPPAHLWRTISLHPLFRRPFHLYPGRPTTGRRLPPPIRRPRSGLAHVARPGQLSILFGRAGPHRKLLGRHAPPRLSSDSEIFVAHEQQHIPLWGFTDLESGDLLGASSSPLLPVPPSSLQDHSTEHPPTPSDVDALHDNIPVAIDASSPTDASTPRTTPCPKLLERLDDSQRESFLHTWDRLPLHLRDIKFDLHGSGWSPAVINALGDILCELPDVFSTSKTDFVSALSSPSRFPFHRIVHPSLRPYRINPILAKKADAVLDQYLAAGLIQHSTSPYSSPMVVIPKKHGTVRITVNYKRLT